MSRSDFITEGLRLFIDEAVIIDEDNLDDEFARTAADYQYLVYEHAKAREAYEIYKAHVASVVSTAALESWEDAQELGGRMSDARAKTIADSNRGVLAARHRLASLAALVNVLKGALRSMEIKKDMLISLGANVRREREAQRNAP
jgi:hypothetical protein